MIFGKRGFLPLGAKGAACATVIAQWVNVLLMLLLLPILVCEVAWSLGENVYTMIYGHMGTEAGAAMVLIGSPFYVQIFRVETSVRQLTR